jgi:hypothetical protein
MPCLVGIFGEIEALRSQIIKDAELDFCGMRGK